MVLFYIVTVMMFGGVGVGERANNEVPDHVIFSVVLLFAPTV